MRRNQIDLAGSNTQVGMIRDLKLAGMSEREAFHALKPLVDSQTPPMVFTENTPAGREPKPLGEQYTMLQNHITRIYRAMDRNDRRTQTTTQTPNSPVEIIDDLVDSIIDEIEDGIEIITENADDENEDAQTENEERPTKKHRGDGRTVRDHLLHFNAEAERIRVWCNAKHDQGKGFDRISMRVFEAANRLIPVGIPSEALLAAMVMHWPDGAKSEAGIRPFNFTDLSERIMAHRGIDRIERIDPDGTVFSEDPHVMFGYVLTLAEAGQLVQLVGDFGTGKSHLARQVSAYLGCAYSEAPMSPGATRGDLLGRHTIGGVDRAIALSAMLGIATREQWENVDEIRSIMTEIVEGAGGGFAAAMFPEIYGNGGIFNFEEIDAADSGMLLVVNNALAGKTLYNPVTGDEINRAVSPVPFMGFSTANTFGIGATVEYTGRNRLDAATNDRWRMGRVWVDFDLKIATSLAFKGLNDAELDRPLSF